ncbi:MAG: SWIB/MDM2 domain-containing protein [Pseudomonadota bacterium]
MATTKKKVLTKKAFGGYTINFNGCKDPIEKIFGNKPIGPSEMTKKIWAYVKTNKLSNSAPKCKGKCK